MRVLLGVTVVGVAVVGMFVGCAAGTHTAVENGTGGTLTAAGTGGAASSSASSGSGGMPSPGLSLGAECMKDADCASGLCKPVVIGAEPVCVTKCKQQSDCGISTDFFCDPLQAGSADGYCVPHSPAHCLSCTMDADCGSLSEVCFLAPGDSANACHVDCSLSGASACPPDYACTDQMVNGTPRKLCRPKLVANCLDSTGGYCDRLNVPQPCVRANAAGSCLGERACLVASKRFDKCGAAAPQCKGDCSLQDPAGCMENFCPSAVSSVANCGMCGNACPGVMKQADNVTCDASMKCTFSCQGENYDVNGDASDGCEVADSPQGNHTQGSAAGQGSVSDCDGGNNNEFQFDGNLPSDKRVHENPAVVGFDANSGSAPDWYSIFGVGHTFCQNNIVMQLCVQNSKSPGCYKLTVISDKAQYSCQTDASGCCPDAGCGGMGICQDSSGQFSDDTTLLLGIQKTCDTNVTEAVKYHVNGHL